VNILKVLEGRILKNSIKNDMRYIFATQSRSGSQFLLNLVTSIVNDVDQFNPQCRFTRSRMDTYNKDDFFKNNLKNRKAIEKYIVDKKIMSMKIEEPSIGDFAKFISTTTDAKWFFSIRKIEDIITSHHNVPWGYSEDLVLNLWRNNLKLYEYLHRGRKPIFAINVTSSQKNDYDKLISFLDIENPSDKGRNMFEEWASVNNHKRQQKLHGKKVSEKIIPKNISSLRIRKPWVDGVEKRYENLFNLISG
jgi:hypothetical protein